jgi:hypothetical protein
VAPAETTTPDASGTPAAPVACGDDEGEHEDEHDDGHHSGDDDSGDGHEDD